MIKRVLTILTIAALAALAACTGEAPAEAPAAAEQGLPGTWEVTAAAGTLADLNVGTTYVFGADNSVKVAAFGIENTGTYTYEGTDLKWTLAGLDLSATATLEGNTLTLALTGSDQVLTLTRK